MVHSCILSSRMHPVQSPCSSVCVRPCAGQWWEHTDDSEIDSELTDSQTQGVRQIQSSNQIVLTRVETKDRGIKEDVGLS